VYATLSHEMPSELRQQEAGYHAEALNSLTTPLLSN
jgi:hypothetical protein